MRAWGMMAKVLGAASLLGVAACASVLGSSDSSVQIRTRPDRARCDLAGQDGYAASVETPTTVSIPGSAAPVTVTCRADGFRPTIYTLDASADGWIWGNSAFMLATGGVAVLGALVDQSRGAGKAYNEEVQYDLTPARSRPLRLRSRDGGVDTSVQTQ